jgi:hypothetical protein
MDRQKEGHMDRQTSGQTKDEHGQTKEEHKGAKTGQTKEGHNRDTSRPIDGQ